MLVCDNAPPLRVVITVNAVGEAFGDRVGLIKVVACALLGGAVVGRGVLVLSQLVVICPVQNTHYVPLSTAVFDKLWVMLGHLVSLFVESLLLGILLRSSTTTTYFGNLHPRRARKHNLLNLLIRRLRKLLLPDGHFSSTGPYFRLRLHVLD